MKILTADHIITGDEYFRQKAFCPYDSDNYAVNTFICYWTNIRYLIGDVWKNHQLKELDKKDKNYPYDPSFLNTYEFVVFDNEEEKSKVSIYSDKDIKDKNKRMHGNYRTWHDWQKHYLSTLSDEEIIKIYCTPSNQCPICHKGIIVSKHGRFGRFNACNNYPECKYVENIYSDTYNEYLHKSHELNELKEFIEKIKNKGFV